MIARRQIIDWFQDPDRSGIASNAELASLLDQTEGFVRAEGRSREVRRVGSAMAWTLDDALELYDELDPEAEEDDEDELLVAEDLDPDELDEDDEDDEEELDEDDE
jgi:hypothetical protein